MKGIDQQMEKLEELLENNLKNWDKHHNML
jgi:hypothetical protein